jgi:hypothetical protein
MTHEPGSSNDDLENINNRRTHSSQVGKVPAIDKQLNCTSLAISQLFPDSPYPLVFSRSVVYSFFEVAIVEEGIGMHVLIYAGFKASMAQCIV